MALLAGKGHRILSLSWTRTTAGFRHPGQPLGGETPVLMALLSPGRGCPQVFSRLRRTSRDSAGWSRGDALQQPGPSSGLTPLVWGFHPPCQYPSPSSNPKGLSGALALAEAFGEGQWVVTNFLGGVRASLTPSAATSRTDNLLPSLLEGRRGCGSALAVPPASQGPFPAIPKGLLPAPSPGHRTEPQHRQQINLQVKQLARKPVPLG